MNAPAFGTAHALAHGKANAVVATSADAKISQSQSENQSKSQNQSQMNYPRSGFIHLVTYVTRELDDGWMTGAARRCGGLS